MSRHYLVLQNLGRLASRVSGDLPEAQHLWRTVLPLRYYRWAMRISRPTTLLALLFMGCGQTSVELSVDLRTDLVPGVEFSSIALVVDSDALQIPVNRADSFDLKKRIADLQMLAGKTDRAVELTLVDIEGKSVATTRVVVDNRDDRAVTLTLARSCVGVSCPTANAAAETACLGGRCVDPTCIEGTEASCPTPQCTNASECSTAVQACFDAECVNGICIYPQSNRCEDSQYCSETLGCTELNAATCNDGLLNQDEVQVDCGGAACGPCPGSCNDGLLNQDEVQVDCGGSCIPCYDCDNTPLPVEECRALLHLYHSTQGDSWIRKGGWLTGTDPCDWFGVDCTNSRVTFIDLNSNNLNGTIPTQVGAFTELRELHLDSFEAQDFNMLPGELPEELWTLTNLRVLHLQNINLSGELPAEFGDLVRLREVHLHDNEFTGSIPASVGQLSNMNELRLDGNRLSGEVPSAIQQVGDGSAAILLNGQMGCLSSSDPTTVTFLSDKDRDWNDGC